MSASSGHIELIVTVSDRTGIKGYGFSFDGVAVPMSRGKGKFFAPAGVKKMLEWVMIGDGGGHMKVTVTRGGNTVKERAKSTIPKSETEGFDAFEIQVS